MARWSSHAAAAAAGGGGHHGAHELLLLHDAGGELAPSQEEENGPLLDVAERRKRLHPFDQVHAGQRKQRRVTEGFAEAHPALSDRAVSFSGKGSIDQLLAQETFSRVVLMEKVVFYCFTK